MTRQPDIVLLGAVWRTRALIRAQLIEEGYDVLAADSWSVVRHSVRAGSKPSLVIVDLVDLEHSMDVLCELRELMQPDRVLVLAGLGTVAPAEIARLGFRVLSRPVAIRDIVAAAAQAMKTSRCGPRRDDDLAVVVLSFGGRAQATLK